MDKGLGILEWTGSLVPQGLLVKGIYRLEAAMTALAHGLLPQLRLLQVLKMVGNLPGRP